MPALAAHQSSRAHPAKPQLPSRGRGARRVWGAWQRLPTTAGAQRVQRCEKRASASCNRCRRELKRAEGSMGLSWVQQGGTIELCGWFGPLQALAVGLIAGGLIIVLRAERLRGYRRRRGARKHQAAQLARETQAMKERLRFNLAEPASLFVDALRAGPIPGALEAFE